MLRFDRLFPLSASTGRMWGKRDGVALRKRGRLRPRLEVLEDRTVLSPSLVADINQQPSDSNPQYLTDFNGALYFSANDGIHGNQLWRSDGTAAGTVMVTDINPGTGSSSGFNPVFLTAVGSILFFRANDGAHGNELWKSDGTTAGTVLVTNLNPILLTNGNGTLYFVASNGQTTRLYKSDGTAAGTVEIAGTYPTQISSLIAASDGLYFATNDPSTSDFSARILWKTGGTMAQPLTSAHAPTQLATVGDALFYDDYVPAGSPTYQLKRADTQGTVTLGSYNIISSVNFGGAYYFSENGGNGLWKSDGTIAGTVRVATFSAAAQNLLAIGGTLYFTANDDTGVALWKTDGTADGTVRLSGTGSAGPTRPVGLTDVNGELYFQDFDNTHGSSLWKSDGTPAGTVRVADVLPYNPYWDISQLTGAGGTLYFVADQGVFDFTQPGFTRHNRQLWESDGTADGTKLVTLVNPITQSSSPQNLLGFNGALYFTADDGVHGNQLYKSNGTASGTIRLTTNLSGSLNPGTLTVAGGTLYFVGNSGIHGNQLWKTDGTVAGTVEISGPQGVVPGTLIAFDGELFFDATDRIHGFQLWKSDGTPAGTVMVSNNQPAASGLDPGGMIVAGDTLYCIGNNASHGRVLWKSDGTADGTVLVKDIYPGVGSTIQSLTDVNGTIYFLGFDGSSRYQLWKSDGTADGTVQVAVITVIPFLSPDSLTDFGGALYFRVYADSGGDRLWKSDGTAGGTVPFGGPSNVSQLTVYNGMLYFAGGDSVHGIQLWKTDGTAAGTVMVTDVNPGAVGLRPRNLTILDGKLVFSGNDGVRGQELWVSDGTSNGTSLVADLNPGPNGSSPSQFTDVNGVVYFTADDGTHGVELWKADSHATQLRVVAPASSTAGDPVSVTVQAVNDFGDIDPNYAGTVRFASSDGRAALPIDYTFTAADAGSHAFTATLFRAGTQTLSVNDLGNAALAATVSVAVQARSSVAYFDLTVTSFVVTVGQPFQLTVTARDAYGNVVTGYQGTIRLFALFGPAGLPSDYTFTAADGGSHAFQVTPSRPGIELFAVADTTTFAFGLTAVLVV